MVRLLNNVRNITVVHQVNDSGWEPFDRHNCGDMPLDTLLECLGLVYGCRDMRTLNHLYLATATAPLDRIPTSDSVGLKMRFLPPDRKIAQAQFEHRMIDQLAALGVVVFIAVRQDVFRWALSKYHGDGTESGPREIYWSNE